MRTSFGVHLSLDTSAEGTETLEIRSGVGCKSKVGGRSERGGGCNGKFGDFSCRKEADKRSRCDFCSEGAGDLGGDSWLLFNSAERSLKSRGSSVT